jgi:cytochrome c5
VQIVIAIACVSVAPSCGSQEESNNPFTNDSAAIAGKMLYRETCQACHSEEAGGERCGNVLYSFELRD